MLCPELLSGFSTFPLFIPLIHVIHIIAPYDGECLKHLVFGYKNLIQIIRIMEEFLVSRRFIWMMVHN